MRTGAFTEGLPGRVCLRSAISTACRRRPMLSYLPLLCELGHMRELSLQGEGCREGSYPSLNGLDHRLAGAHVSSRASLRRAIRSAHNAGGAHGRADPATPRRPAPAAASASKRWRMANSSITPKRCSLATLEGIPPGNKLRRDPIHLFPDRSLA